MPITDDERVLLGRLNGVAVRQQGPMTQLERYYDGQQRLKHIGWIAPDELLRQFQTVVNVPRVAVDEPVRRQSLKAFQRSNAVGADPADVCGDRVVAEVEAGGDAAPAEVVDARRVFDDHRERAHRVVQGQGDLERVRGPGDDGGGLPRRGGFGRDVHRRPDDRVVGP